MAKGQVEHLMPMIEATLAQGGATWRDLTAIGVGVGPGNFTGIRLSVSAARGLAMALNVPAVGVSALEAAGHGTDGPVLACIDARRDRVYLQGFDTRADLMPQLTEIAEIAPSVAQPGLACIGSGAAEVAAHLGARSAPAAFGVAEAIARIAASRWRDAPGPPTPLYLRAADAAPAADRAPEIIE